ncbi:MAG: flagellar filament capping protein FliD [Psychrobacillus sp.]
MVMRVGGLASGMDIDALVEKLMQAERIPLNKTFQKKQTLEWQRDAYRNVNTVTQKLNKFLEDKMFLQSQMMKKTATSSNDNLVSVNATGNAMGALSIESVTQLASTTQKVGVQTGHTGSTKLSELGLTSNSVELSAIDKDGNLGKAVKISFDPTKDTINDFVKKINSSNAGVTALFENGQLSLTANNTGSEKSGKGEIVFGQGKEIFNELGFADESLVTGNKGQNAIFKVNGISMERSSNKVTVSGYEITLKETFNAKTGAADQVAVTQKEWDNAKAALVTLLATQDATKQTYDDYKRDKYDPEYAKLFGTNTLTTDQQAKFNSLSSAGTVARLENKDLTALRSLNISEEEFANATALKDKITNSGLDDTSKARLITLSNTDLKELNSADGEDLLARAKQVDYENTYKSLDKKFLTELTADDLNFLNSINGKTNEEIDAALADESLPKEVKDKFKGLDKEDLNRLSDLSIYRDGSGSDLKKFQDFYPIDRQNQANLTASQEANSAYDAGVKREAQAEIAYNNAVAAQGTTANDTSPKVASVGVTSTSDTTAIKDRIKEFVTTYNEMLDTLNNLLKEKKYRDYAPLTTEQREDMSENEQKLWDEKSKSGLLRGDSLIRESLSKIRSQFVSSINGLGDKTIDSFAEIGITTSDKLTESGKLVINEKKLDEALQKDPQQVVEMFTKTGEVKTTYDPVKGRNVIEDSRGLTQRLRVEISTLTKNIEKKAGKEGSTEQSYNIGRNIVQADDRITKLQTKLKDIEARYWKQFTAMETAINKANQQSSMFMQG